ncbi:uncharacterized protein BT62DRAFT_524586 [Guyanagaster necrorhizus]|uniref:RING-CH-type domain-containing protein n=1 Tax=Guyanagaster necrorhizus TaxID=856835 RepID=A0A9P7W0R6_9AGAR|nr:uncharacterized protein BT62DRAFT_524586 [Guyanagaster necrorhizus MCA 3950]KAG7450598.1 hypothetical protein BT62DRAFT_524586 [Guyanagaster necrorhizus MCA 3950]
MDGREQDNARADGEHVPTDERQCRICLDGADAERELGRLIRPCLCRGSISYVHIKCLQRWRNTATSQSAFFSCPQCHYKYRFSRTRIVGIATNPVILGAISTLLFTILAFISSSVTTYLMSFFQEPTVYYSSSLFYVSPFEVIHDLVRAALRIFQDEDLVAVFDEALPNIRRDRRGETMMGATRSAPGLLRSVVQRFLLGLPLIGAGSLIQMLLSLPFLGPVHWLARYRGNRRRNNDSRDITALIIIVLIVVGAARALYKVYQLTHKVTKQLLLRAEDAILEVN